MFRKTLLGLAAVACLFAAPATAQVVLGGVPGGPVYSGPPVTYDFESPAPVTGGLVTTGSVSGIRAQPLGSTGNYWTVGPADGTPGFLDLSNFTSLDQVSFIWGSVDLYNTLDVVDRVGGLITSFTGADVVPPASGDGNQFSANNNPLSVLAFLGSSKTNVGGLRFSSTQNAFEIDNVSVIGIDPQVVDGVPEPGTWATLLFGFGALGAAMRRKRSLGDTRRLRIA